ncbi:MAG: hypothetical protein JKY84_02835 [Emcibacteraceae bacterium]|nr:hypothetical protein [Emcibacteraceae bacterium]
MKFKLCLILGTFYWITSAASAQNINTASLNEQFINDIRAWITTPVVNISVDAQNKKYDNISQANIDELDQMWRAEEASSGNEPKPLIAATLNNPLSIYLTQVQAASGGLYTEIFVTDRNGLNVGQSAITSDFWQGDEAKFQKTFDVGPNAIFIDEPEFHDGTQTWRVQINLTVTTLAGQSIGAATIEVNLTEADRRR